MTSAVALEDLLGEIRATANVRTRTTIVLTTFFEGRPAVPATRAALVIMRSMRPDPSVSVPIHPRKPVRLSPRARRRAGSSTDAGDASRSLGADGPQRGLDTGRGSAPLAERATIRGRTVLGDHRARSEVLLA